MAPERRFAAYEQQEALSFAEEGGISIQPVAVGYIVLGRRRRLTEWAQARGLRVHQWFEQVPTIGGVWHLVLVGSPARQLDREYAALAAVMDDRD